MISDHIGYARPARTLASVTTDALGFAAAQSVVWRTSARTIARPALTVTTVVLRALGTHGNPAYFQFERRGPVQQRLGPGVWRESDSFWPISQW